MNKTAKGALAAGTAAVLLMGGAGSLAYWSDTESGGAGAVTSGKLTLDVKDAGFWTHNGDRVANPQAVTAVPGDVFNYEGSYVIGADGNALAATLAVSNGTVTNGFPEGAITVTPTFTFDGNAVTGPVDIDGTNDGGVLQAEITIDLPFGDVVNNDSQLKTLDLTDYVVTLTQTDASSN